MSKRLSAHAFHALHDYHEDCSLCNPPLTESEVRDLRLLAYIAPNISLTPHDWARYRLLCDAWLVAMPAEKPAPSELLRELVEKSEAQVRGRNQRLVDAIRPDGPRVTCFCGAEHITGWCLRVPSEPSREGER